MRLALRLRLERWVGDSFQLEFEREGLVWSAVIVATVDRFFSERFARMHRTLAKTAMDG